jgi:hypothetical protein
MCNAASMANTAIAITSVVIALSSAMNARADEDSDYSACMLAQVFSSDRSGETARERLYEAEKECSQQWSQLVKRRHQIAPATDPVLNSDEHLWADQFLAQQRARDRAWYAQLLADPIQRKLATLSRP